MTDVIHHRLPCGIEFGALPFKERHVISMQVRILAGNGNEPESKLGLANLVSETIDKGTAQRTGRELSDAFDAIGASHRIGTGRETISMSCTVLPEHLEKAIELQAEMLRTPTFPKDTFEINKNLALQEITSLEDDAHSLTDKLIGKLAYGPILGRHPLGEKDTIAAITHDDLTSYWQSFGSCGRMLVTVAGPIDPQKIANLFQKHFEGFGEAQSQGHDPFPVEFSPVTKHYHKKLEQEQISICWPGVEVTHDEFPAQQVMLGLLSGGMSGRLFTEVREKLGLVYWVSAWQETPRGYGMIFLGASTKPERCDKTYAALLKEVDRLAQDITPDEMERAITGIVANYETRGDSTHAKCSELANDLFYFGRPIPAEEKIGKIKAVDAEAIRRYLTNHPRDKQCVVTLGPRALGDSSASITPAKDTAVKTKA